MLADSRGALVALQARDFERAVTFYSAVLGLEMTFRHENLWAEFRAPGLVIGIGPAGDATVVGGGTTTICFEVRDIVTVVDGLRARGVSFQGSIVELFHGREASFTDSEGNPFLLHQSSAPQSAPERRTPGAKPGDKPARIPAKRSGPKPAARRSDGRDRGKSATAKPGRSSTRRAPKGKKGKR